MGWLGLVKAVLPHAGTIVSMAAPAFTHWKNKENITEHPEVVERQIEELQAAALQNSTHIKELAEQLQTTAKALEQAMLDADAKVKRARTYCALAIILSIFSSGLALFALWTR